MGRPLSFTFACPLLTTILCCFTALDCLRYRSGIYYHTEEQREIAIKSMQAAQAKFGSPIVTEVAKVREACPLFPELPHRILPKCYPTASSLT